MVGFIFSIGIENCYNQLKCQILNNSNILSFINNPIENCNENYFSILHCSIYLRFFIEFIDLYRIYSY